MRLPVAAMTLLMYEIASFSKHAHSLTQKHSTFFGFVFGVKLLVFSELVQPMSKFTSFLIGTLSEL